MILKHLKPELNISENLAIIGSSAKMLQNKAGEEIDSFDDVIRFNRAPTAGFEDSVGSKTTLRVVNPHVYLNGAFTRWDEDEQFVLKLRDTRLVLAREPHLALQRENHIHNSVFLYTVRGNFGADIRKHTGISIELPTVGLMGIMIAVLSDIKPVVYGWSTTVDEPMSHYFNKRSPVCSDCHKWDSEIKIIQQLRDTDQIEIR